MKYIKVTERELDLLIRLIRFHTAGTALNRLHDKLCDKAGERAKGLGALPPHRSVMYPGLPMVKVSMVPDGDGPMVGPDGQCGKAATD